jgi:tetratricopeptide (TPR) repeat protein
MYFLKRYSWVLRLPLLSMGWLLPLAVVGAVVSFREKRDIRLHLGYIAAYCFSLLIFFVFSRYRLHVVPLLAVFAALGIQWFWTRFRERDLRHLVMGIITVVAVGTFSFFGASTFGVRQHEWINSFWDLSLLYEEKGDYKAAQGVLFEALKSDPERPQTLCVLGRISQKMGNHDAAIDYLTRCLELDGNYLEGWYLLGVSYEAKNDIATAMECYRRVLMIQPNYPAAIEKMDHLKKTRSIGH